MVGPFATFKSLLSNSQISGPRHPTQRVSWENWQRTMCLSYLYSMKSVLQCSRSSSMTLPQPEVSKAKHPGFALADSRSPRRPSSRLMLVAGRRNYRAGASRQRIFGQGQPHGQQSWTHQTVHSKCAYHRVWPVSNLPVEQLVARCDLRHAHLS